MLVRANGSILLFLCYGLLSVFWSDFPDVAFKRWIRALGDISMAFVILSDSAPGNALATFLQRTGLLLLPPSILFDVCGPCMGVPITSD